MTLEPLRADHARETAPLLDDPRLHAFTGGRPATEEALRARYDRLSGGGSPDGREGWLNWVVRSRETAAAVGTVQATLRDGPGGPWAELAWVIGSRHQGRGLAKEAAGLMAGWLRGRGVRSFVAHIHPEHEASMAVARHLGLAPTGEMKDGEVRWASDVGRSGSHRP